MKNNIIIVDLLIDNGVNINSRYSNMCYRTLLDEAVLNHNKDIVKLLLKSGVNINTKSNYLVCLYLGCMKIVRFLLNFYKKIQI